MTTVRQTVPVYDCDTQCIHQNMRRCSLRVKSMGFRVIQSGVQILIAIHFLGDLEQTTSPLSLRLLIRTHASSSLIMGFVRYLAQA